MQAGMALPQGVAYATGQQMSLTLEQQQHIQHQMQQQQQMHQQIQQQLQQLQLNPQQPPTQSSPQPPKDQDARSITSEQPRELGRLDTLPASLSASRQSFRMAMGNSSNEFFVDVM